MGTGVRSSRRTGSTWILVGLLAAAGPLGAAPASVDFRQGANQDPTRGSLHWINSILNPNNSSYYEGMGVPQRILLTDMAAGSHSLTFVTDATKGGLHGYDFLMSYDQAADTAFGIAGINTTLNPCGDEVGPPGDLGATCGSLRSGGYSAVVDVPDDTFVSADGLTQARIDAFEAQYGNRTVRIYANAPIQNAGLSMTGHRTPRDAFLADGGDTGDSSIAYQLTWTSDATAILVEMAGHLSVSGNGTGIGWGAGRGASFIKGGPYHISLTALDDAPLGNRDNQIMLIGAVEVPPPSCVNPVVSTTGGALTCLSGPTVTLHATSDIPGSRFTWSTANGRIVSGADGADAVVSAAGVYQVTVTSPAGCSSQGSAQVADDRTPPNVAAAASGALNCLSREVTLHGSSSTPNARFSWSAGGGGHIVSGGDGTTPVVDAAGTYTLTVTDPATGCTSSAPVVVENHAVPPVINAPASAALGCSGSQTNLTVSSNVPDAHFSWTASNGGTILSGADTASVLIGGAGSYLVTVTNPATGCSSTQVISAVSSAGTPPEADAGPDMALACGSSRVTLQGRSSSTNARFHWSSSDGGVIESGDDTPSPVVTAPGTFTLTVTDLDTLCTSSDTVRVARSGGGPNCNLIRPAVLPGCGSVGNTLMVAGNGVSFAWRVLSGSAMITGGASTNTITYTAGTGLSTFEVTSTGPDGCTSTCSVTFGCPGAAGGNSANEFCTLASGLLGLAQCPGNSTLSCLLGPDGVTVGVPGVRSLTIRDTACLSARFPVNGAPTALPAFENGRLGPDRTIGGPSCDTGDPAMPASGGRFANVLLGQTILLTLSTRLDLALSSFVLPDSLTTVPAQPGADGSFGDPRSCGAGNGRANDDEPNLDPFSCNTVTEAIPVSLVGLKVEQLLALANQALAGQSTTATVDDIYLAVRAVMHAFEGCRFLGSCPSVATVSRPVQVISEPIRRVPRR